MTKLSAPKDNLGQQVAQHIFENQRSLFPHLTDLWPLPSHMKNEPDRRTVSSGNPFHLDRQKASALTSEVPPLYSAMAFAMWRYGVVMNVHLTICWRLLRVTHQSRAVEWLSLYNHEAAKWLDVGVGDGVERRRLSRRASGTSAPHMFVYVHENARDKGFHSHELLCLPASRAQAFAEWSRDCLGRLTGKRDVDERAVFFSPASKKLKQFKPYEGGHESFAVKRQWEWFRYITKSLHPDHMERAPDGFGLRPAREIFGMTHPFIETPPVTCTKLAGYSENIGPAAQRRAKFVSKFDSGDFANLYNGSELDEFRECLAEAEKRSRETAEQAAMKALLDRITI